jgi:two-component system response regulator MprA
MLSAPAAIPATSEDTFNPAWAPLSVGMAAPGDVVRRRDLVRAGWPDGAIVHDNNIDQYVARLRRKLAEAGDHGRVIRTVVGVGYRFQ